MVSQGGRGSAGRCRLQKTRFQRWAECGWRRPGRWLLPAAGGCWHHSHGPWESPLQSKWQNVRKGKSTYMDTCVEEVRLKAAQGKMTLKPGRIKNTAVGAAAVPFAGFCFQCQALCLQSTETAFHIPDQSHTQTLVWTFPGPLSTLLPL